MFYQVQRKSPNEVVSAAQLFESTNSSHGEVNHRDTSLTYTDIGDVYYALGEYECAQRHYIKALEIQCKILSENKYITLKKYFP